jgi:GrpB-like predicted nucleotidyltransferase (UPF0157 family)
LEASIGDWVVGGIHHVGSTAVPDLAAKPISDILVGVQSLEAARALRHARSARVHVRPVSIRRDALVL